MLMSVTVVSDSDQLTVACSEQAYLHAHRATSFASGAREFGSSGGARGLGSRQHSLAHRVGVFGHGGEWALLLNPQRQNLDPATVQGVISTERPADGAVSSKSVEGFCGAAIASG